MQENKEAGSEELVSKENEQPETIEQAGATAGGEVTQEVQEPKPKKLGGFQRKALRLEAELNEVRVENERLKAGKSETASTAVELKKPKEEDFTTVAEYYEAVADHKAEVKIQALKKELESKETNKVVESTFAKKQKEYNQKAEEYSKANPDFQEALQKDFDDNGGPLKFSALVNDFLLDSEVSPALMHEFAKDRELLEDLNEMTPIQASRELVKLEQKFSKPKDTKTTKAPTPPNTLTGRNATSGTKDPHETGISFAEYDRRMVAVEQKKRA